MVSGYYIRGDIYSIKGQKLVAVCDIDSGKAEARARELGLERWYPSINEMLANEECDLVDVVNRRSLALLNL